MVNCDSNTFSVAQLLRIAAHSINVACDMAGPEAHQRLGDFEWQGITCSLDELAAELNAAAEYLEEGGARGIRDGHAGDHLDLSARSPSASG